jgi:hypothetical protein
MEIDLKPVLYTVQVPCIHYLLLHSARAQFSSWYPVYISINKARDNLDKEVLHAQKKSENASATSGAFLLSGIVETDNTRDLPGRFERQVTEHPQPNARTHRVL